ncbi:MAG: DUF1552 domain-containing protein [Myxococcota bacterium]|nr:DUF1552 domain-containing protein [Myxococcota bacterium]
MLLKCSQQLSRRRFLRGACGAALVLPTLEWSFARADISRHPRFLVYYLPNGRRHEWWNPNAQGQLPDESGALRRFAERTTHLIHLDNNAARRSPGAAHAAGTSTCLTGRALEGLSQNNCATSVDQVIANHIGAESRFKSLQWSAGEPGPCDVGGSACSLTQSVSWADRGQPLLPTINPRAAFDQLFSSQTEGLSGERAKIRRRSLRSVLDFVLDDARDLQQRLGVEDRARLERYFQSVREVEQSLTVEPATCDVEREAPGERLPYPERVAAFQRLIQLAFQCDQTRVISFMIEFGLSSRSHDFLNAAGNHHALSHYGNEEGRERLRRIEIWQAEQLASTLDLLRDTPGLEGSLFDETVVLVMPSMGQGSSHAHDRISPKVISGSGLFRPGRHEYGSATSLNALHATLIAAYQIQGAFGRDGVIFGDDGDRTLGELLA